MGIIYLTTVTDTNFQFVCTAFSNLEIYTPKYNLQFSSYVRDILLYLYLLDTKNAYLGHQTEKIHVI